MFEISRALSWTFIGRPRRSAISRRSAFARFTRYSASLICPAIATAVAPSSMKSLFTALDPTKKPLLARLSAARTTPSEHVIPIVVVILGFPEYPMAGRGHIDSKRRESVTARGGEPPVLPEGADARAVWLDKPGGPGGAPGEWAGAEMWGPLARGPGRRR